MLLSRRDWVYSLSLLVPFVVYDLTLKAASAASQPGLALTLDLLRSDVFFDFGYVLLWIGLFAAARSGPLRKAVVVHFHVTTILVVLVNTCAYQYFKQTGTALDYSVIALWLPDLKEVMPVLTGSVSLSSWVLLFATLFYFALGPWVVTRVLGRSRGWAGRPPVRTLEVLFLGPLGLWLLALGFGSLSLLIDPDTAGASKSVARDPFMHVVLTGVEEASTTDVEDPGTGSAIEQPAEDASLAPSPQTEKRNVVLIHLESTRAGATTPYNGDLPTTPFLDELAKQSLVAERAYTTVPHTSKASVSVNCGIFPQLVQPTIEADPGGIPSPCLADLLKEEGYGTVFFQSSTQDFENFGGLVENFGYEDYYPLETMETEGFERSNYFGVEDDVMLKPSEEWLKEHEDEPFMAEYLLGTGHHDYQCLGTRYGQEDYSEDDLVNRYLNCMRLQDIFVKNLFQQYRELGLYENTIFVVFGDHGEAFGEHGRFQHDDVPYQEGLKVPVIIHAPGLLEGGERVQSLSNHTDILPTMLEMLGYEVKDGEYPGYSLLHALPEDRTLMFSCFHEDACLARIKGSEKYIYHYDNQPDELFNFWEDPLEQHNLVGKRGEEEMGRLRAEVLAWRSSANAAYRRE